MGDNIKLNNSIAENCQIGGNDNLYIAKSDTNMEWEKLEQIWQEALYETKNRDNLYELVKQANELTKKRDKTNLKRLIKSFLKEFTVDILSSAASEVVLKFII